MDVCVSFSQIQKQNWRTRNSVCAFCHIEAEHGERHRQFSLVHLICHHVHDDKLHTVPNKPSKNLWIYTNTWTSFVRSLVFSLILSMLPPRKEHTPHTRNKYIEKSPQWEQLDGWRWYFRYRICIYYATNAHNDDNILAACDPSNSS